MGFSRLPFPSPMLQHQANDFFKRPMTATSIKTITETPPPLQERGKPRLVILTLPPPAGIAYYGALLANAMSRYAHVRAIICEEMKSFPFAASVDVAIIRKEKIFGLPHPRSYRRVLELIEEFQPEIVHDTAGNAFKWSCGLWPLLARRWPLVVTEHDPQPHVGMNDLFAQMTRRVAWQSARHLIVHGPHCRQALLAAGVAANKISINRHGSFATYDQNRHAEIAEEEQTVLFFGELRPNKGVHRLAALARIVQEALPHAKFIVAGKCTKLPRKADMEKVRRTMAALKAAPGFEVHDRFIPDDEVEYLFRRSALVILPYAEASQSGVIPVAYAFRKPVIAYRVGDLSESIMPNETGLLIAPEDENAFGRAIVRLLRHTNERRSMGRTAYDWSQRELAWDSIARRTVEEYGKMLVA